MVPLSTHRTNRNCSQPTFSKPAAGDAFEDVLYGSESELDDDSEDDRPTSQVQSSKKKAKDYGARLRLDDDEPTDLLQGATSKITSMLLSKANLDLVDIDIRFWSKSSAQTWTRCGTLQKR